MKVFILVAAFVLAAYAAVIPDDSLISSLHADELDPLTAATLETFGGVLDDGKEPVDDDADGELTGDDEEEEYDPFDSEDEIIYANVTADGMIEVEDTIISPDMFDVMFPSIPNHPENGERQSIHKRVALSSSSKFWPSGKIPYAYNTYLLGSKTAIRAAMDEWEKYTCVKFRYRSSSDTRYVQVRSRLDKDGQPDRICSSTLGYTGKKQYVNLGKNCFSHRTLLHELGHTLGLIHEHQHPDRDRYVTIVWNNINPVKKHNFNTKTGISSYGITYDPTSIMHYQSTFFKKTGCTYPCYTMVSKVSSTMTKKMGKATHLSQKSDIPIINQIYRCPSGK